MYKIAQKHFGGRVHFWRELYETGDERQWGYYGWDKVHDADQELRKLEAGQEQEDPTMWQEQREISAEPGGRGRSPSNNTQQSPKDDVDSSVAKEGASTTPNPFQKMQ